MMPRFHLHDPEFDRRVFRARDDRFAIGSKGDGADDIAVGVLLLLFELESGCK
jgi:hypothetical protein